MLRPKRNKKFSDTDIERILSRILAATGEPYVAQFRLPGIDPVFSRHKFDFALPHLKIVAESDGCLWHGCSHCYPGNKRRGRDRRIAEAVRSSGWLILRWWGCELKSRRSMVEQQLEFHISEQRRVLSQGEAVQQVRCPEAADRLLPPQAG